MNIEITRIKNNSQALRYGKSFFKGEEMLFPKIREGNSKALSQLLSMYKRLVASIANKVYSSTLTKSDLIVEGNLGLMKAAERFDETKDSKFITFASYYIKGAMLSANSKYGTLVKVPEDIQSLRRKIRKQEEKHLQIHHHSPSYFDLAEALGVSEQKIKEALICSSISMDQEDEDGSCLRDRLAERFFSNPVEVLA